MTPNQDATWRRCPAFRDAVQALIDLDGPGGDAAGELVVRLNDADLTDHYSECEACRDFVQGHVLLRIGLSALPVIELSAAALDSVWANTIESPSVRPVVRRMLRTGWAAAAAAAAALVAISSHLWTVQTHWAGDSSSPVADYDSEPAMADRFGGDHTPGAIPDSSSPAKIEPPDRTDLKRAASQMQLVFALAQEAFGRVENAALDEAVVKQVSETVLRVPRRLTHKLLANFRSTR